MRLSHAGFKALGLDGACGAEGLGGLDGTPQGREEHGGVLAPAGSLGMPWRTHEKLLDGEVDVVDAGDEALPSVGLVERADHRRPLAIGPLARGVERIKAYPESPKLDAIPDALVDVGQIDGRPGDAVGNQPPSEHEISGVLVHVRSRHFRQRVVQMYLTRR